MHDSVLGSTAVLGTLDDLESYRKELTGYCYRMLGSAFEADDAVQETMVKAWKAADSFEGRSSVRSWLYRIATNVCLDALRGRGRRAVAMDLGPSSTAEAFAGVTRPEDAWLTPIPDGQVIPDDADPAEVAATRETIKLAFVTALQHLPAKQRACLILCEVLKWQATEAAELLDTSVASINSALQRARATLGAQRGAPLDPNVGPDQEALLARYVDAFERYDIEQLVTLLRDDVVLSMPPWEVWLVGPDELAAWFLGPGIECQHGKLLPLQVNGTAGFGNYHRVADGVWEPWAIQVIEVSGGRIAGHHNFLYPDAFADFGLPARIEA